ncbi:AbrB/MazE/SpoVT family DNA-binding domain-containing protein [Amycolatopsis sp. cg5]|uniref:AbrB/MazE/SpoVT family DNA-binding domain-containing protein n=1 Tax=Amycolatopsis sp. cg5 TaxID=3238802 RepID=UPI0035243089
MPDARLPLVQVPITTGPIPVTYAMAKVDASGRVSDQAVLHALGWMPGEPLTITAEDGAVIIRRDPRGVFTLAPSGYIQIPAPLRTRYGLRARDRILLAAVPRRATLLIYTTALLHQVMTATHTTLLGGEQP